MSLKIIRRLFAAALIVSAAAMMSLYAGPAGLSAEKAEGSGISLDVTETTLDNGLKVILLEDHSVPVISYQTYFHVGSRNERPGITGISHFMEHMMFNGAEKYGPKEFDRILEANGGYSNAFTSNDMTAYYEDFASDVLELVVDLDTDRMRSLALDEKSPTGGWLLPHALPLNFPGLDTKAGHGMGKPTAKVIEEYTDELAFIVGALGMEAEP